MSNPNIYKYGKQFSRHYQPPKKNMGRKPSKLRRYLKDNNMGAEDLRLICSNLLNKTRTELEQIIENKKTPVLVYGSAVALLKDMAKGNTSTLQWLADRGYGKAPETVYQYIEDYSLTREEKEAAISELLDLRRQAAEEEQEEQKERDDV